MNASTRNHLLIGTASTEALAKTSVILFGVGGVGSWCAEALIRSGVKHLTLVDGDAICISNINRQLQATTQNIGQPKVEALKERLLLIAPDAQIVALHQMYNKETKESFNLSAYDYVIDAIDSLSHKVSLILNAMSADTILFASMGAAGKLDPTQIQVTSIWDSSGCKLAKFVRKKLRRWGATGDCLCVYSEEVPPAPGTKGSMIHLTGSFGFYLAGLVIQDIHQKNPSPDYSLEGGVSL